MDAKGARARAIIATAADIDERTSGYRERLVKALVSLLRSRDQYGTEQSRRTAIEDELSPIAKSLLNGEESGNN